MHVLLLFFVSGRIEETWLGCDHCSNPEGKLSEWANGLILNAEGLHLRKEDHSEL